MDEVDHLASTVLIMIEMALEQDGIRVLLEHHDQSNIIC